MPRHKLKIIYEDKDIIVIDKPAGILSVSTPKEHEHTLFHEVYDYLKHKNKHNQVFIVHRLDKDTSGLVLFAKNEQMKFALQNDWDNVKREYIAITEGKMPKNEDVLKNKLAENANYHVYVSDEGKLAITEYKVINTSKSYNLLQISIKTGRKNQIRAQLAYINNPIIGDSKYESRTNPLHRLGLHASKLTIMNPKTKKLMTFESDAPKEFYNMFKCKDTM